MAESSERSPHNLDGTGSSELHYKSPTGRYNDEPTSAAKELLSRQKSIIENAQAVNYISRRATILNKEEELSKSPQ